MQYAGVCYCSWYVALCRCLLFRPAVVGVFCCLCFVFCCCFLFVFCFLLSLDSCLLPVLLWLVLCFFLLVVFTCAFISKLGLALLKTGDESSDQRAQCAGTSLVLVMSINANVIKKIKKISKTTNLYSVNTEWACPAI